MSFVVENLEVPFKSVQGAIEAKELEVFPSYVLIAVQQLLNIVLPVEVLLTTNLSRLVHCFVDVITNLRSQIFISEETYVEN